MQIHIISQEEKDIDLDIEEITLLSKEEAETLLTQEQRLAPKTCWWLRDQDPYCSYSAFMMSDDGLSRLTYVHLGNLGILPALRFSEQSSVALEPGDKFSAGGENWTVISDNLAWCDHIIGHGVFREDCRALDANVYKKSDIKKWLETWALERGIVTQENIELFNMR